MKRIRFLSLLLLVIAVTLLGVVSASALGGYTLDWWTVDGGGAMFSTGGNYSLGTTVEALLSAIQSAKDHGGIVIAERKKNPGEPCILHFYKDPKKVPQKYIDRIGMNKKYWHEES